MAYVSKQTSAGFRGSFGKWIVLGMLITAVAVMATARLGRSSPKPSSSSTALNWNPVWSVSSTAELLDALENVQPAGGTICLSTGTYVIDQTIEIRSKSFLNLIGTGWDARIVRRGDGDALKLIESSFCTVRNLLIQGDESAEVGSAICFKDRCNSCAVESCRIVNFPDSGVRYEGNRQRPMSSNTIRYCHLIGNLGDQLWSQNNNDFYIIGNQFGTHREHPRSGCVLDHSSAGTYSMNYHWGNHVALRMGPGANFNRVENNRFEECRENGLVLGTTTAGDWNMFNIVSGNTFHTNSQSRSGEFPAVLARNAHETTFCGNQIFSWDAERYRHKHSLQIDKTCDRWIVKDNIFRHNTGKAVVYDSTKEILVKDNLMD